MKETYYLRSDICISPPGGALEIIKSLGISISDKHNKGTPCPLCGGRDRFSWTLKNNTWVYYCRHCGGGNLITLVNKLYENNNEERKKALKMVRHSFDTEAYKSMDIESSVGKNDKLNYISEFVSDCFRVNEHEYLTNKGIYDISILVSNRDVHIGDNIFPKGSILVPGYIRDTISCVQLINKNGSKTFIKGSKLKGSYHLLNGNSPQKIFVVEGYATAISVWLAMDKRHHVAVSFSASNLKESAKNIRSDFKLPLTFLADNDESNIGLKYALEAKSKNELVFLPPTIGDWDDFRQSGGDIEKKIAELELSELHLFRLRPCFDGFDSEFGYLIKHYLPTRSFGVLYGASGSYKSFHALNWATHIALGRNWNGHKVQQGSVLYVAGEGGLGVPRRIKGLADTYNDGKPVKGLHRLDHAVSMSSIDQVNLLVQTLTHYMEYTKEQFSLIVLDTLARCFSGDENRTEDMGAFISACDYLKTKLNLSILVVHHSGVSDKDRARGSSALRAASDFEYRVERVNDSKPKLLLSSTKSKDEIENASQTFTLEEMSLFTDSDGDEVTTLVVSDAGQEHEETEQEKNINKNHKLVCDTVGELNSQNTKANYENIKGALKQQEVNVKNLRRWIDACESKSLLKKCNDEYVLEAR
ncbi:AAA family ATPase [Vibrio methylphosphonaticus]|uniref:AAA family ATPase n=1 Tax=Vibrio methylphosphonaticus TaxID=2946866 RepID=UPI00202A6DAE|nr:AAA family ATPase [Vibrio methylphosphonaticus]MCL9777427.1 AAA family ATPase [Vibrio methylphosphonaticus]